MLHSKDYINLQRSLPGQPLSSTAAFVHHSARQQVSYVPWCCRQFVNTTFTKLSHELLYLIENPYKRNEKKKVQEAVNIKACRRQKYSFEQLLPSNGTAAVAKFAENSSGTYGYTHRCVFNSNFTHFKLLDRADSAWSS